jgi:hypothetical protein
MPRIFNQGENVDQWYKENEEGTSGFDVCRRCWPLVKENPEDYLHKLVPYNQGRKGPEPQGTHFGPEGVYVPWYEEDGYRCAVCDCKLREEDNEGYDD